MINKVILVGNVGRKPELRTSSSGKQVCMFSLATNNGFGEKKTTDWHNIVCFDKIAEMTAKYIDKGAVVYVEGKIQYDKYEKNGESRISTRIIANNVTFMPRDKKTAAQTNQNTVSNVSSHTPQNSVESAVFDQFSGASYVEDLPF